jgi:hypothetical protein
MLYGNSFGDAVAPGSRFRESTLSFNRFSFLLFRPNDHDNEYMMIDATSSALTSRRTKKTASKRSADRAEHQLLGGKFRSPKAQDGAMGL